MHTPLDPASDVTRKRDARASWSNLAADAHGVVPLHQNASPDADRSAAWRSDLPDAARLVRHTVSVGALASGVIEYMGWQIAQRAGAPSNVVPLGEWALGLLRNLGGAAALGFALACVVLLVPRFRKRPLRAASAAFAFGVAGFLGFLFFLVSLAP